MHLHTEAQLSQALDGGHSHGQRRHTARQEGQQAAAARLQFGQRALAVGAARCYAG